MASSRSRQKALLVRARRLSLQEGGPRLLTIIGDPEVRRLGLPMASNREAMIGEGTVKANKYRRFSASNRAERGGNS